MSPSEFLGVYLVYNEPFELAAGMQRLYFTPNTPGQPEHFHALKTSEFGILKEVPLM